MSRTSRRPLLQAPFACVLAAATIGAEEIIVSPAAHHIRSGATREWSDFPAVDPGSELSIEFDARRNESEWTLCLRQRDVKQAWEVHVNGEKLASLVRNENEMLEAHAVKAGVLRDGTNRLRVFSTAKAADDIVVGDIRLRAVSRERFVNRARVSVTVVDADSGEALPARLTITDRRGYLVPLGAASTRRIAVRTGCIFTADGKAEFGVSGGEFELVAGRGFEYGIARSSIAAAEGETIEKRLEIRREVPTPGLVACDTHVHTFTHSRHGDATIEERMVTVAAEGIELPIATDHNLHIDYEPAAAAAGVRGHFTPVIGNEVTTSVGHFNIFPVERGAEVPDWKGKDWSEVLGHIRKTPGVRIVVLNHPRGLHANFRPFGPRHHISIAGENLDGWQLEVEALELVNSAALQSDGMLLFRDWFGLLNRGLRLAPVGSSDSHDVARHFVGQGRTYIPCPDDDPGNIDVEMACRNLAAGRALLSMGLLTRMTVNERFGPGDTAPASPSPHVEVEVLGPSWARAERVALYANGVEVREATILPEHGSTAGVKWRGEWRLPALPHDVYLVAMAWGPGVRGVHWRVPKSYQPASPDWRPYVVGVCGAIRIDADGDGEFSSARDYAARLIERAAGDLATLVDGLGEYDRAVAAQAASLLRAAGVDLEGKDVRRALEARGAPATVEGFETYVRQWRASREARQGEGD